jgi:hypothetical protein
VNECNLFGMFLTVADDGNGSFFTINSYVKFSPVRDFLQCCSTSLDATGITIQLKNMGLNV